MYLVCFHGNVNGGGLLQAGRRRRRRRGGEEERRRRRRREGEAPVSQVRSVPTLSLARSLSLSLLFSLASLQINCSRRPADHSGFHCDVCVDGCCAASVFTPDIVTAI